MKTCSTGASSRRRASLLLAACLICAAPRVVRAQAERFEMGLRLVELESLWLTSSDSKRRARALPHVQAAVRSFFAMAPGTACRALDEAVLQLRGFDEASSRRRWARALSARPTRFIHDTSGVLSFDVEAVYPAAEDSPPELTIAITVVRPSAESGPRTAFAVGELPQRVELPFDVEEGDHDVVVDISAGDEKLRSYRYSVAFIPDLDSRMQKLGIALRRLPAGTPRKTVDGVLQRLRLLQLDAVPENRVRAASSLRRAEQTARDVGGGKGPLPLRQPGDHWVHLDTVEGVAPARLQIPAAAPGPAGYPLVVALHGAGGTEHLFFEGYGAGKIVELCRQKNWLLIAPRLGPFSRVSVAAMVDALESLAPVDRGRVFLVGHSMGASRSLSEVRRNPGLYRAVAAISGGFSWRIDREQLGSTAFFVAAGASDFGRRGARAVLEKLRSLEHPHVVYKEYPLCEHLLVMAESLDDIFDFFTSPAPTPHRHELFRWQRGDFASGALRSATVDPDSRHVVLLADGGECSYESPAIQSRKGFNEALISWNVVTPPGTGFSVEVRVGRHSTDSWSPYLYVGDWGWCPPELERKTSFTGGKIDIDYFVSKELYDRFQYRVRAHAETAKQPPLELHGFAVCVSDMTGGSAAGHRPASGPPPEEWQRRLAVPYRSQKDADPAVASRVCSPASLAMLLEYRGVNSTTDGVARLAYDPVHRIYGNWPRAVQAAFSLGAPGYLTRFSTWSEVERSIAADQPLIISIAAAKGQLRGAPYSKTDGHLLVLTGFDSAGNVTVNDPAAKSADGGRTTYYREDLARVWLARGGTAYVIEAVNEP